MVRDKFAAATVATAIIGAIMSLGIPERAMAIGFYYEAEIGAAKYRKWETLFDVPATSSTNWGPAFNLGLFVIVAQPYTPDWLPLEVQLGIQGRASLPTADGSTYGFFAPYPMLRIQLGQIFTSFGATRWVYTQSPGPVFQLHLPSVAYVAEVGLLWAVTPKFSLGAVTATQFVNNRGVVSPAPVIEISALLRFYFGTIKDSNRKGSIEFEGWRYPFGRIR
jgi:hypothetical protein